MSKTDATLPKYTAHRLEGALRFRNNLAVGTEAPDFELQDLQGSTIRLSDYRCKSYVVLVFGSMTCGSTVTQLRAGKPPLNSLYHRYKTKSFEFFLVYTREPHPGENIPQPSTSEERKDHAQRLKEEERVNFPILVDTIDNKVRSLYHAWPNSAFIIDRDGLIVYKSSWTYGPELAQVLKDLCAWERAKVQNALVRMCHSERLVGLLRNRKISALVCIDVLALGLFRSLGVCSKRREKRARGVCAS